MDPSPTSSGLEAGLHALVLALKARDEFTWRHSMRVADLAGLLAFGLGWPVERVWLLHNAGLLHDIGKIALPDRLLKSRGPLELTPNDRELLRAHPGDGAEIAAEVLSADQLAWVRHHHERWDGLGYPHGLGGHTIPEGARLLALAEAWDAMTAPLSRELQLTHEDALADCWHEEGAQFAPDAVAALTRISGGRDAPAKLARPVTHHSHDRGDESRPSRRADPGRSVRGSVCARRRVRECPAQELRRGLLRRRCDCQ